MINLNNEENINWFDVDWLDSFEPTLNPFKNGLLVNYKKVGTRYMGELLSLPYNSTLNKLQMDVQITRQELASELKIYDDLHYQVNYEFYNKFCYTEFDKFHNYDPNNQGLIYNLYSNSNEFLNYCGVKNYNELFFENKKDIIFLIRNPLQRFFSGVIQILYHTLHSISDDVNLRKDINFYTGLTDSDLNKLSEILVNTNPSEKSIFQFQKNEITLLVSFLIEKKWDLLFQDIHTQNYLFHFVEWIHHIHDKNKIKIIDLKDCRSNKSLEFFVKLMGNTILKSNVEDSHHSTYWEWMTTQMGTNTLIYNLVINKIVNSNPNFLNNSSIYHYLKSEIEIYKSLTNSPYFIDLKD